MILAVDSRNLIEFKNELTMLRAIKHRNITGTLAL